MSIVERQSSKQAEPPQVKNSQAGVPLFATWQKGDGLPGMDYPEPGPAAAPGKRGREGGGIREPEENLRGKCKVERERESKVVAGGGC